MRILQGRLRGKLWIAGSSTHGCWLGSYEHEKQRRFETLVQPHSVVFDIGTYVGFYTLLASELVGKRGRVFAFEPLPRNLFYLKRHIRLNHRDNVKVFEAAVSDHSGTTLFDEGPGSSMGSLSERGRLQVRMVALDELIEQESLPLPNCVKIDVEGAEMSVLCGARQMLEKARPRSSSPRTGRTCIWRAATSCAVWATISNHWARPIWKRPTKYWQLMQRREGGFQRVMHLQVLAEQRLARRMGSRQSVRAEAVSAP